MKRLLTPVATTLMNSRRLGCLRLLRPRLPRKLVARALIFALVLVPLLGGRTITPTAQAQIITCGGPSRIFQDCPLGGPYEFSLETQALDELLAIHQLPASDRSLLLGWQRNELRGLLYGKLLGLIKKAPAERTAEEQTAYQAFAARIKQLRLTAAQSALDEYNKWQLNPCLYAPPEGFTYPGAQLCAAARLNPAVAGPIDPPKFEEFQAYGVARAYESLYSEEAQQITAGATRAAQFFGGLAAAPVAGGIGLAIAANLTGRTISAIFPYAFRGAGSAALAAAAGISSATVAIAGGVVIVVTAIVIGVLRGIDVFSAVEIPGKLQAKKTEIENAPAPDLAQLIATDQGLQEVYAAFLLMTLPDFQATDAIPAPEASDPKFLLRQDGAAAATQAATLAFKSWEGDTQTVRLKGGWFINQYKDKNNQDKERWTLKLDYIDWNGERWTAARAGASFIHTIEGAPDRAFQSPEIKYQDGNGTKFTASLLLAELGIEAFPVVLNRLHDPVGGVDENGQLTQVPTPQTLPVALVNSGGQLPNTLTVSVNNAASATVTGVTISNLSVDSNGRVTASLSARCEASAATFTLKVTDSVGQSKTASLVVQLSPLAHAPSNPLQGSLPDGAVGARYNGLLSYFYVQTACFAGAPVFTVTSGKLPPGLSFGVVQSCTNPPPPFIGECTTHGDGIVGTPTSGGSYTFTVQMSFSNGDSFSRTYTLYIDSAPAPLPSGALHWWSGERGLNDDLKRKDGSSFGGFGNNNFALGKVGLAFHFDGSNRVLQLPRSFFPFNSAGNQPFTFETWFKTASSGVIFGQQNTEPYSSALLERYTPGLYVGMDGKLRVQMFANGTINPLTSEAPVNDDCFHHVAVIYDGAEQIVYLDGSEMGRAAHTPQQSILNFAYQFGTGYTEGWPASNNSWFNFTGLIDEPTLYNRALTVAEVQSIFAAGGAGKIAITATPFSPTCDASNGVVSVNVLGGKAPFTYSIDDGSTFQEESLFSGLSAGDHTIKVKDVLGHVLTQPVTINALPPLMFNVSAVHPTCSPNSGSLTINASGGTGALMYSINNGQSFQTANVFANLAAGAYQVVVKDASDCTSAAQAVTLVGGDTVAPETTLTSAPAAVSGANVSFSFTGTDNCGSVSFECKLDNGDWTACTSPQSYNGLANGSHTFRVRAKDAAGNVDATPATYTWQAFTASCGTVVNPTTLVQARLAMPFAQTFSASPAGSYSFSLLAGTLPPGLQLTNVVGIHSLRGTPTTPGTYTFTIKAKKNNSTCEGARTYTMVIAPTVIPLAECIRNNGNGTFTAFFGYENSTGAPVTIPIGANNFFSVGAQNRGQPMVFQVGRVTNAFTVTFQSNGSDASSWMLKGPDGRLRSALLTPASPTCP